MASKDDGSRLRELRRGVVQYCVLALLTEREHYGYELVQRLSEMGQLVTSEGTVYPLLGRLHDAELVTTTWRQSDAERPRKYYAITPLGLKTLESFRQEWIWFRDLVDEVLNVSHRES